MAVFEKKFLLSVLIILAIALAAAAFILTKPGLLIKEGQVAQEVKKGETKVLEKPDSVCIANGESAMAPLVFCCDKEAGVKPAVEFINGECVVGQSGEIGVCVVGWNKTCGDGVCDADSGENRCSCARDCNPDGSDRCAEEGEVLGNGMTIDIAPAACCEGLVKISSQWPVDGKCEGMDMANLGSVCAKCGDGACGIGENKCNCPQDCDGSDKCVGEGGYLGQASGVLQCCDGLVGIDNANNGENNSIQGACNQIYPTCAKCGDGVCGIGENNCNCAKDCKNECKKVGDACCLGNVCVPGNMAATVQYWDNPAKGACANSLWTCGLIGGKCLPQYNGCGE